MPSIFIQALALLTLPLAHTATTIGIVALIIGIGNGASSGIVMTLGSDASPNIGRPQFLAAWRLLSDTGSAMGPIVVTLVTLAWPLSAASIVVDHRPSRQLLDGALGAARQTLTSAALAHPLS